MSKSKLIYTCSNPDHKGYKLQGKKHWCRKCKEYKSDGVEQEPKAPIAKIDISQLTKPLELGMANTLPKVKQLPINELLTQLPFNYRNADLCPSCNPVRELVVCTNRHAVVTDKKLEGMTVEDMISYLRDQFNLDPDTNERGQAVRWLVKRQIIVTQTELGIHKAN